MGEKQTFEEKIISLNELKVNYKIAGSGPAILVLHGWGGSSNSWVSVQKILTEKGYQVLVPDLPGFGKTPPYPEPWGVNEYADFVLSFAKEMGLGGFYLIGHSFGGRISIRLSSLYPEKVKSLILCDAAGIKTEPGHKTKIIHWIARIGNALFTPKHLLRMKNGARNTFYMLLRNKDYVKADGVMRDTIKKVLKEDLLPDLPKIKVKTLIVWGENDKIVPLRFAHVFKEKIEGSRLEILPKIGHSPHLEVPERLSELIIDFFS